MPKLSPGQPFGPIAATVTLDGSGNGAVQFQATGSAARITNLFGKVSTSTSQATVSVYVGTIADTNRVFNNNSGSTGFTASGQIDVPDGTIIYVVWTGGDAGAVATATFSGRAIPFDQIAGGFEMRADDPIAAGDGSLIFPAIKSPNFVAGTSGWRISRTGVAEFLDAIIRGTIDIAGGIVTINNAGIFVEDATHRFLVNTTGGFQAVNKPADGSGISMQDQAIFFDTVTPYNGSVVDPGFIYVEATTAIADFVNLRLVSPRINGQARGRLVLWGASDSGVASPTFDIGIVGEEVRQIRVNSIADIVNLETGAERYGRGKINLATDNTTANLTTTSQVVFTFPSVTYKANRAFEVLMDARYSGGNNPSVQLRKGTTTGSPQVTDGGRVPLATTVTQTISTRIIFITGGSDVTTQLCLTMTSQATSTQSAPRRALINDIGPASDYSIYDALT